jgi:hypothetical protein
MIKVQAKEKVRTGRPVCDRISKAKKRCQQDSNLQPPVPETDALPLRHDTLLLFP